MKLKNDPAIARIRETRHLISQKCGHDPQKVVEYYIELQKRYQARLLVESEQGEARTEAPPELVEAVS